MSHSARSVCRFALLLVLSVAAPLSQATAAPGPHLQQLLAAGHRGQLPGVAIEHWAPLKQLYEQRGWALIWSDAEGAPYLDRQQQLSAWIALSHQHGLDPRAYGFERLRMQPQALQLSGEALLNDLLMSDAFIQLALDLSGSRLDLQRYDPLWHLPPKVLDPVDLLLTLDRGASVHQLLQGLLPRNPEYNRLMSLYVELSERTRQPYMPPALPGELLRAGDVHAELPLLRNWLIREGVLNAADSSFEQEELYTERVADAVRQYQQQQGLADDGIYGPDTRAAMLLSPEQKRQQVRVNMVRWRALPHALGRRYLLVRTGSFMLDLVDRGEVVQRHAIISGRPQRPSHSFVANMDTLVLNPPWTVPFRLAVEDLLPKQQQDPAYFERLGIEVLQQQQGGWQPVSAAAVDWSSLSQRNFHYLLRQRPGPHNSLGRIRFGMANPYSIFLHDTPQQSLFNARARAFSSGCIRVRAIEQLAQTLLGGGETLHEVLAQEQTRHLPLPRPVPVYLVYLTVWVDELQQPYFHSDLYDLDRRLADVLGPPPSPPSSQMIQMAQRLLKK